MSGRVWIGCSGWAYPTWRPAFYPEKTPIKKLLTAYAEQLNSVEVNYTFRTLPTAQVATNWLAQTPAHFRFVPKAPERITHILRLHNAEAALQAFVAALAPIAHAGRLGPALFQLPPGLRADALLLDAFLSAVRSTGLVTAWEFRHPSWFADPVYDVLAARGTALCAAESDTLRSPDVELNSALRVFRLRRSSYNSADLDAMAEHFLSLAQGGAEVYAFFKHEEQPDGPLRARDLLGRIPPEWRG